MLDKYNREIIYLRISVTDRCNLRCYYCIETPSVDLIHESNILSFEEIINFVKDALEFGIKKVKFTGGEPLIRSDIIELISILSKYNAIKDLSISTNGILLSQYADNLKKAGLDRINVSLDTLDKIKFKENTGGGDLNAVIDGLNKAKESGFHDIKLNCVIKKSSIEPDAINVMNFAVKNNFGVRFIRLMNLNEGNFWPIKGGDGGHCYKCNRIRLSCDGKIFPCLFNDNNFSIKDLGNKNAIIQAINAKPKEGYKTTNKMYKLGG